MIAVIDYGAGNLRSISRALEVHGADVVITGEPDAIRSADRVVLPGVGNAKAAMERLHKTGIARAVNNVVQSGKPLLGVCLGMQLLFNSQEEGPTNGLGLLEGNARRLSGDLKIPHMGWNTVTFTDHTHLAVLAPASYYFVHSYVVHPTNMHDIAARTDYGVSFPSIVIHDHIWGVQFHPEKSGENGLKLLKLWLDSNP